MLLPRRASSLQKGVLAVAAVALIGASVWVLQNQSKLAAACLRTWHGVTSRVAHLSEPFGIGANVESRNPVLGVVPDFSLTERSGRPLRKSDLIGSYWIASFIFTRCATSCPMAVMKLAQLQSDLPEDVRLVSFSVDPEHDSPGVLADYAEKAGADVDHWLFVTGEKSEVYTCIREGFNLAVEQGSNPRPGWEVTHSPRFALVDPKGRIRGYYDSSDPADLERLRRDVRRLSGREAPG